MMIDNEEGVDGVDDECVDEDWFVEHVQGRFVYEFLEAREAKEALEEHGGEVWTVRDGGSVYFTKGFGLVDRLAYRLVTNVVVPGLVKNQVVYGGA
jgi:hypothetical protein